MRKEAIHFLPPVTERHGTSLPVPYIIQPNDPTSLESTIKKKDTEFVIPGSDLEMWDILTSIVTDISVSNLETERDDEFGYKTSFLTLDLVLSHRESGACMSLVM